MISYLDLYSKDNILYPDILTAAELIEDLDDDLFQRILRDKNHLLHALLPDRRRSLDYGLRPRSHDRELVPKASSLIESNFSIRQLRPTV